MDFDLSSELCIDDMYPEMAKYQPLKANTLAYPLKRDHDYQLNL